MHLGYVKNKREKNSRCNICGKLAPLTWDHVPPKGGIEVTAVEQETILSRMTRKDEEKKYAVSQNGVKYRTLCPTCNNDILGRKYDPILNEFAIGIGRFLKTNLELPEIIEYEAKPTSIIRAIMGHLLAAKAEKDDVLLDQDMRRIVLDENVTVPDNIKVFYWIYPYPDIVVIRDIVMPAIRGRYNNHGFFSILKYFPMAYLITNLDQYEDLYEMTIHRNLHPNMTTKIKINLKSYKHPEWPEIVDEGNMIAGGSSFYSSIHARPRK